MDFVGGGVFLVTQAASYRLLRPASAYEAHFASCRRKFELSLRAATLLALSPQAAYDSVLPRILSPEQGPPDAEEAARLGRDTGAPHSEAALLHDAPYVLAAVGSVVPGARERENKTTSFLARLEELFHQGLPRKRREAFLHTPAPFVPEQVEEVVAARGAELAGRLDWRGGLSAKRPRAAALPCCCAPLAATHSAAPRPRRVTPSS